MKASKRTYLWYTAIFLVLVACSYGIFILTGKSFIWEGDGLAQHFPILEKFYSWLHSGSLTGWSWDLGLGADKLTTFSYYVLGDPFSYLIAFFPHARIELGYNLLILLRLYVSGLAFLFFARQRGFKTASQLFGTLTYTFTGFSLYVSIRHPFFLLPMILFPLLAFGVDHVLRGKSWVPLAIFTGLALVSNFYFAYILAIGSLIYAVLRYFSVREHRSLNTWPVIGKLVGAGFAGFMLAGVLFIPSLLGVMSSTRATAKFANGYFVYPFSYYLRLSNTMVTTGNPMRFWVNLGLAGITFLALVYVLRHFRRYLWLNIAIVMMAVGTLIPAVAAIMNGGTTPSQRWLLLGCLAFSLAVMAFVDNLTNLDRGDLTTLMLSTLGLLLVVWLSNGFIFSNHPHDFVQYGLLLMTLGIVLVGHFYHWSVERTGALLMTCLALNLIGNAYGYFSPNAGGASSQLVTRGVSTKYQKNFYDGAQAYVKKQKGFARSATSKYYYFTNEAKTNMGMNLGTHDIMSYFSVENGAVGDFSQKLDNSQFKMNKPINQADSRTTMSNLLGVKYIFARNNQIGTQAFPYAYQVAKRNGKVVKYRDQPVHDLGNNYGTTVLKSKDALPLAYLQTSQINSKQFAGMNGLNREQALTYGAEVQKPVSGVKTATVPDSTKSIDYHVEPDKTMVVDSLGQVVKFRQQGNQVDPELITTTQTSLRQKNQDRSVNITNDRARLKKLAQENAKTLAHNEKVNANELSTMTSDNMGNPMTYHLLIDRPVSTKHTELYLELDGIKANRFSVRDKYHHEKNTKAFSNQAYTGIARMQTLRSALWNQSDGAYTVTATSFQNVTSFNQLGQGNLSDYQNKQRVLLNLGYSPTRRQKIKLTFSGVQSLKFKSAKLVAVPFNKAYSTRMHKLQKQGLKNLKVKNNLVKGSTNSQAASVLTTSIPYSQGWKLTVDGHEQPTTKVNVGFVGAKIPAGKHQIRLAYRTPGLKLGGLLTLLGVLVVVFIGGFQFWWSRRTK
ncbi:YfhO family protein [Levilactobacillus senmaizukei]|uniref:YfhO family protein n=1 Tax=Levilactobacillus senmaizukei TaxID=431273 RepID=UPI00077BF9A0|nr:YfhO family protein [Levilactobacillus senmaizukei]